MIDILWALILNKNSVDEKILITLRNWSLKTQVKPLMIFLYVRNHDTLPDDTINL